MTNPQEFINSKLNKSEKYILYETEDIAEYLIHQGSDLSLEDSLNFLNYKFSDIIYRTLIKRKRIEEEKEKERGEKCLEYAIVKKKKMKK